MIPTKILSVLTIVAGVVACAPTAGPFGPIDTLAKGEVVSPNEILKQYQGMFACVNY